MPKSLTPIHIITSDTIVACGKPHSVVAAELDYCNDAIIELYAAG